MLRLKHLSVLFLSTTQLFQLLLLLLSEQASLEKNLNKEKSSKPTTLQHFEENNLHQAQVQVQSYPRNILKKKTNLDQVLESGKPLGNRQAQPVLNENDCDDCYK